ncbi:MAG: enoyl-CoA hydratase-related protein [Pseudomonadota bacterium]
MSQLTEETPTEETLADGGLLLSIGQGIATVTLSRPDSRNAVTEAMWRAIPPLCDRLANEDVRAVLLTGAGDHFCGGADVAEFHRVFASPTAARSYNDLVEAGRLALTLVPCPTIAVVRGYAVGAGCGLSMACDLRFVARDARFSMPPARLGAAYPVTGTRQLVDLVGPSRAKDMLYSGRMVDAEEALAIGLADRVFASENLMAEALVYAESVANLSAGSHRITKQIVQAICYGVDGEPPELRSLFDGSFAGDDFAEGYRAFLEKRRPSFR